MFFVILTGLMIGIIAVTMVTFLIAFPVIRIPTLQNNSSKALDYAKITAFIDVATAKEPELENCGIQYKLNEIKRFSPWHAVIYHDESLKADKSGYKRICGGTLISKKHIITHQQCVKDALDELDNNNGQLIKYHVILGKMEDDVKIVGAHEQEFIVRVIDRGFITYETDVDNIISLLISKNQIMFSDFVRPICLSLNDTKERQYMKIGSNGLVTTFNRDEAVDQLTQKYTVLTKENCCREDCTQFPNDTFCGSQEVLAEIAGVGDICSNDKGTGYAVREPTKNNEIRYFLRGVFSKTKHNADCDSHLQFIHITSRYSRELLLYGKPWYYDL